MADTKITALTALTGADPANDVIPIVDVSDTTMAASGTTKKISVNNILGASGTATLASATITGNLTVDTNTFFVDSTNNRIGVGTTTPLNAAQIQGAGQATVTPTVTGDGSALSLIDSAGLANSGGMVAFGASVANGNIGQVSIKSLLTNGSANGTSDIAIFTRAATSDSTLSERFRIAQGGVCTWSNVGGVAGTAMTLNSTGLGVGVTPSYKLHVQENASNVIARFTGSNTNGSAIDIINTGTGGRSWKVGTNYTIGGAGEFAVYDATAGATRLLIDASGQVGLGVTPSAWGGSFKAFQIGSVNSLAAFSQNLYLSANWYNGAGDKYIANGLASQYAQSNGTHAWFTASNNTLGAGATCTLNQVMTLDAAGYLLLGTTDTAFTSGAGYKFGPGATPSSGQVGASSSNADLTNRVYSTGAAAYRFYVGYGGTVFATNTTISAISDQRLKENVQDIDVGLGAILALKPRKFDWKAGKGKDIKGDRGFIAQEFEQVFPQLVDNWADPSPEGEAPYKSVRQDLIPVLVKAIQELAAEVNALKNA